jgi:hypothetical protein
MDESKITSISGHRVFLTGTDGRTIVVSITGTMNSLERIKSLVSEAVITDTVKSSERTKSFVSETVMENLLAAFNKQSQKFATYLNGYEGTAKSFVYGIGYKLCSLGALRAKISITESPSLIFKIDYPNNFQLRFEVFLETQNVAFSLYQNDELQRRNHGNIINMLEEVIGQITPTARLTKLAPKEETGVIRVYAPLRSSTSLAAEPFAMNEY